MYLSIKEWLDDLKCQEQAPADRDWKEWAGGRESALPNTRSSFHPWRKWMEVLPVHNQHPSCLQPLSRGWGFIWIIRQALLLQPSLEASVLAWPGLAWLGSPLRQPETDPLTKGQLFDPPSALLFCFSAAFFWVFFFALFTMSGSSAFTATGCTALPTLSAVWFFIFCHNTPLSRARWLTRLLHWANFGRSPAASRHNCVCFFEWNSESHLIPCVGHRGLLHKSGCKSSGPSLFPWASNQNQATVLIPNNTFPAFALWSLAKITVLRDEPASVTRVSSRHSLFLSFFFSSFVG